MEGYDPKSFRPQQTDESTVEETTCVGECDKDNYSIDDVLEELLESSAHGILKVDLEEDELRLNEKDTLRVEKLNEIFDQYKRYTDYDLMKYKLTSDALGIALWDMDVVDGDPINPNNVFTWSKEFRAMLGFSDVSEFPNILASWSDRLHMEDKFRTLRAFEKHMMDRTGETPYDVNYRLKLKNGKYRHFRAFGTTYREEDGTPIRVAGALQDLEEEVRVQEELAYRDSLLNASNKASSYLFHIRPDTMNECISKSMALIGEAVNADRLYIWRNFNNAKGERMVTPIYEWDSKGYSRHFDWFYPGISYADNLPIFEKRLARGETINALVKNIPAKEGRLFTELGVISVLIVPIFINELFWGFAAFDDCKRQRNYLKEEEGLLLSISLLIADVVIRNEAFQATATELNQAKADAARYLQLLQDAGIEIPAPKTENETPETNQTRN